MFLKRTPCGTKEYTRGYTMKKVCIEGKILVFNLSAVVHFALNMYNIPILLENNKFTMKGYLKQWRGVKWYANEKRLKNAVLKHNLVVFYTLKY